jgi:hypothetical protein
MNAAKQTTGGRAGRRSGWTASLTAGRRQRPAKPFRPRLEPLEGRDCPALSSSNVAIIGGPDTYHGGFFPTTGPDVEAYTFTTLSPAAVNDNTLANFDTTILNLESTAIYGSSLGSGVLSAGAKQALVTFVGSGHKLIIMGGWAGNGIDYGWLPFDFKTNDGPLHGRPTITDVEENTLSSTNPASAFFIDTNALDQTDALSLNFSYSMVTPDPHWKADLVATYTDGTAGPVQAYAEYSAGGVNSGLIIYNGLPADGMPPGPSLTGPGYLRKVFVQDLEAPFDPFRPPGNPSPPPGIITPTRITLTEALPAENVGATHVVKATVASTLGQPLPNVPVTFSVVNGPNQGATGTLAPTNGSTDAKGQVSFAYVGRGGAGTDTVVASCPDQVGFTIQSTPVTVTWGAGTGGPARTASGHGLPGVPVGSAVPDTYLAVGKVTPSRSKGGKRATAKVDLVSAAPWPFDAEVTLFFMVRKQGRRGRPLFISPKVTTTLNPGTNTITFGSFAVPGGKTSRLTFLEMHATLA